MPCSQELKRAAIAAVVATALLSPASALAQAEDVGPTAGDWSPHAGLGFMLDPDGVLLAVGVEYAATDEFSIGPLLQLGFEDDHTIVAPTLNGRVSNFLKGRKGW